jgi:AcrR family transcriptional regulator
VTKIRLRISESSAYVVTVTEKWTQERRREHTRNLLLDAAEEVFTAKGFEGASLDEIAETAGYTRGAIYKHFADKADLFLQMNGRLNDSIFTGFQDLVDAGIPAHGFDIAEIARRWHDFQQPFERFYALGAEFNLYVLRNPDVRERVAEQRRRLVDTLVTFMDDQVAQAGARLRMPTRTLARIALAAGDGLSLADYLDEDEDDLFGPFLELFLSAWEWDES